MSSLVVVSLVVLNCGTETNKEANKGNTDEFLSDTARHGQYLRSGAAVASQTGAALIKNLTDAIEKGGTSYAIEYCNTRALPLTDTMGALNQVHLKRVSDRPRNPQNQTDSTQLNYIRQLNAGLSAGEKPKPHLTEIDGKIVGYYPIITNDLCMKCHGNKSDMDSQTLARINQMYPSDAATGYAANQLRGLWVVTMDKN